MAQQTVAFLGLGGMGHGMAANLVRAGFRTIVWNRRPEAAQQLARQGAAAANSPADAVREADVVVTMVTDADAVMSIAADQGMLHACKPHAIWAQMSTIGLSGIERVAALVGHERPDVVLVDAPVAGSRRPAEEAKLTIFASGPDSARPSVTPIFQAMAEHIMWVGELGAGSRVKLVNNVMLAFVAEGIAESIGVGHALGLDVPTMLSVLGDSPLVSPWAAQKLHRVSMGEYTAEYPLSLALKDLCLALDRVDRRRFAVSSAMADEWRQAVEQGAGAEDITVMTPILQR